MSAAYATLQRVEGEKGQGRGNEHGDEPLNIRYDATATGSLRQAVAVAAAERRARKSEEERERERQRRATWKLVATGGLH